MDNVMGQVDRSCGRRYKRCRHRCRHVNLTTIGFALGVLSIISSCVTIGYFIVQMLNLRTYDYLYEYRSSICTPVNGFATNVIIEFNATTSDGKTCPSPWIMIFLLADNQRSVTNPFALQETRLQAIDDRNRLTMGNNYSCLCRPYTNEILTNDCSVWPQCIFNAEFVHFMQRDNDRYYRTYISFILAAAVSASLAILAIPSTVQSIIVRCLGDGYVEMD